MLGFLKRSIADTAIETAATSPAALPRPGRRLPAFGRMMARMFDGARTGRLEGDWPTTPLPADDVIRRNQRILVARSREQATNNDYMRSFLRMCRQNIVGPRGVQLQAQPKDANGTVDNDAGEAIEEAFREWSKAQNCDITGRRSWRAMQGGAVVSAAKDGEFMFRKVFGTAAGEWGFALQALDPQRCPVDFDEARRRDGTFVRHGIEFSRYGKPTAYYFTATDDEQADYHYGGRRFVRVPANEIIHGFLDEMVGQKRGLPWTATALWRMQMMKGFENAALVNARVGAAKGGFFEWEEGYGPDPEDDLDEEVTMEVEPGVYQELPPGLKMKEVNPQYPSGEFAVFIKAMLRGMASGLGVAYNNLANDLENVNFSSIRQGALDERESWKDLQEWLIEQLIEPVFEEWLPRALLAGRIRLPSGSPLPAAKIDKFRRVMWQPRRWAWIDPSAEVKASIDSKNNMLASPGQIIRDTGRDPDTVWREMASDIEAMRSAGIPEKFIMAAMGQKQEGGGNAAQQDAGV